MPSATRDWAAFEVGVRKAFAANVGTQIGWFPEPLSIASVLVSITGQGTSSPTVAESFSLTFRQSVTFQVQPDLFELSTTVLFEDASNSLQIANSPPATLLLTATPPAGATVTFQSQAPFTSLALSGPFAGTASTAFELAIADLVQFEAGMMYFSPPVDGGLVNALSYPVFRGAGGSTTPFGFNVTLDVLGPLDAARSFFQFTDPLVGSTFVTTNGKPFALATVNTGDIVTASRLIFRPAAAVAERTALLLSDAGGTVRPGARHQHQQGHGHDIRNRADAVRRHRHRVHDRQCRPDTGQTRVRAGPAGVSHPACARFANQSRLSRRHRDNLVAQLVSAQGTYVSQPERAPLYKQPDSSAAMLAGAALDILWVPGGDPDALARIMSDPASPYLAYLRKVEKHAKWVCSVCEGALLLARAGLLDGHRATTHWAFVDCLRRFQAIKVARGHPRFVESGNRLTGGGISSGLDEALHLIARLFDDKTAADVQTTTQYFPVPPVACKVPSRTPTCMVHW
ncbi:DJ-1/PfpI family protein [Mesorhizobium sp. 113-3-3]|uniref:DJ-1/PfpI family protein n=1 Tax=Mesorhizobium sp. 113-3-3 TaxID=2744516 RepID=UPI0019366386|nr:DJ-1/PfpI family protein [Mesorhizobium sp. 113-3-3]BCG81999.1 hypothetical protein MesoLj113b_55410 [Mesorhizobium sp. 113-3-3]